jgi:hypothetical protein
LLIAWVSNIVNLIRISDNDEKIPCNYRNKFRVCSHDENVNIIVLFVENITSSYLIQLSIHKSVNNIRL